MCRSNVEDAGRSSNVASVGGVQHQGLGQQPGVGVRALASESPRPAPTQLGDLDGKFQPL